ncbi:TPA: hypothetical protein ACXNW8_001331 [Clostridium botulinum]|uniref:hypothetical protein n=1 Tax=Clostridium botulinum TaxID=1491 RepID=UPI001C9AAB27|nr:hypothetical protein [Clostridium botulinum]MBY6909533.1 hypothetical protein [Clostridium botulinum]
MLVKTWVDNIKDTKQYLTYNGYGKVFHIVGTDYFICLGGKNPVALKDVKIVGGREFCHIQK